MKATFLAGVFVFFFLSGCAVVPSVGVSQSTEMRLSFGQTVFLWDANVPVTFADVLEDSRCPQGMECFWEGRVLVLLRIGESEKVIAIQPSRLPTVVELHSPSSEGYCLVVTGIFPLRLSPEPPEKMAYALTFRMRKTDCNEEKGAGIILPGRGVRTG